MKPSERLNAETGSGALFAGVQEPVLFIERLPTPPLNVVVVDVLVIPGGIEGRNLAFF